MEERDLRKLVVEIVTQRMQSANLNPESLNDDISLIDLGVIDSFGFLELTTEIEERTGIIMDFSEADPEDFTSVNGLINILQA